MHFYNNKFENFLLQRMSDNSMLLDTQQHVGEQENLVLSSTSTNSTSLVSGDANFNPFTPSIETPAGQLEPVVVSTVQTVDDSGKTVTLKAAQLRFPEVYKQHVAKYGRQIEGDEKADLQVFTAMSVYRTMGNNADILNDLQQIKTKEQLDAYFMKRNTEVENLHHMLDKMEKSAECSGKPLENPLENPVFKKHLKDVIEQMEKTNMLDDAPDYKIAENTVDARVATIQRLHDLGYELSIKGPSKELREKLNLPDSSAEYQELEKNAKKIDEALRTGFMTSDTSNPSDPKHAAALAEQIEGAAQIKKKYLDNRNTILRCDRTSEGKSAKQEYYLEAKKFADDMHSMGQKSKRLDLVLPVEPVVVNQAMASYIRDWLVTELLSFRFDTLVHPSKLYLYMMGTEVPKHVLFSDVRYFYGSMIKFLRGTNIRPKEAELMKQIKKDSEDLHAEMKSLGLAAVISKKPIPDAHMETHSKERIHVNMMVGLERAAMEFTGNVQNIIKQTPPNNEEATRQCLLQIYEEHRQYCVKYLNALEIALFLFYEEYIPFQARADLMTSGSQGCACCIPEEAIHDVNERREWIFSFRKSAYLNKEHDMGRYMSIDNLTSLPHDDDKIDPLRASSPTWKQMHDFVRYFVLNIKKLRPGEECEESKQAHRWVTKYIASMHDSK